MELGHFLLLIGNCLWIVGATLIHFKRIRDRMSTREDNLRSNGLLGDDLLDDEEPNQYYSSFSFDEQVELERIRQQSTPLDLREMPLNPSRPKNRIEAGGPSEREQISALKVENKDLRVERDHYYQILLKIYSTIGKEMPSHSRGMDDIIRELKDS